MNPISAPLSLGEVLSRSWGLLAPRLPLLVGLQLTAIVPAFLFPLLLGDLPEQPTPEQVLNYFFPGFFLLMTLIGLLSMVATGATVRVLAEVRDEQPVTFADAYGDALAKFFPLLWTQVCTSLTLLAALIALALPWIILSSIAGEMGWGLGVFIVLFLIMAPVVYVLLRLIFAFSVLVMVEDESGFGAVRRSFELSDGQVLRILILGFVLACLAAAILIPILIPVGVITVTAGPESALGAFAQLIGSLAQLAVNLLMTLGWTAIAVVLYFELTEPEAPEPSDNPQWFSPPPAL